MPNDLYNDDIVAWAEQQALALRSRSANRRQIEPMLGGLYTDALDAAHQHMAEAGPPIMPLPVRCPWTLDELLTEGEAARHWQPPP